MNLRFKRQEEGILLPGHWTFIDEAKKEEEKYSFIIAANVNLAFSTCLAHATQCLHGI